MAQIEIRYNPYKVETEFLINNEPIRNDSSLAKQKNKRLQYWLEKNNNNWNGIIEELIKVTNDNVLDIIFQGRSIDFQDLKLTVEKNKGNNQISLRHIDAIKDTDILKEIEEIINCLSDGPIEELRSSDIKKTFEAVKSTEFKVNVIATMSSGKSTLINSLIGFELLPSENKACTATIARIKDNDDAKTFTAECKDENENLVYEKKEVCLDDIKAYNTDEKVTYIDIEGPIPNISSEKMNLLLVDTPGPNNSRNEDHGKLTESIINDKYKGVVLYVINATQFGINDDKELLEDIAEAMKRGGKQSKDRFIFAINKCDQFNCEKEESIEGLLEDVTDYLAKFGIEEPNLFPVSAQTAKLIRMYKNDIELTRQERRDLGIYEDFIDLEGYHFDKMASLSEYCRRNLEIKLLNAKEAKDEYEEALIHTGIPAIEEAINEYLEKYAYPIKINEAVQTFLKIIEENEMMVKLDENLAMNEAEYKKVRKQIEAVKEKLKISKSIKELEEKIDKFGLDENSLKDTAKVVDRKLEAITRSFANKDKIEKQEAERVISKFKSEVSKLEKNYESKLNRIIKSSVIDQGEKLVNEYQEYIEWLSAEIDIKGFNFKSLSTFSKVNIEDVEDLMYKYSSTEDIYQERTVKNESKKWYKPWTWGEDSYYTVTEKVGTKDMIDVSKVIGEYIAKINSITSKNINDAKIEGRKQSAELKEYFKAQLRELHGILAAAVNDLDNKTKNQEEIQKRVEENKYTKNWLNEIIQKLNSILNM